MVIMHFSGGSPIVAAEEPQIETLVVDDLDWRVCTGELANHLILLY